MQNITITFLPYSAWQQYRNIRLEALQKEPAAYSSTYQENVDKPPQYWMDRLQEAVEQKNQWLYFAQHNNTVVGMAGAFTLNNVIHIIAVYVKKEYRGQGIAFRILNRLLEAIYKSAPDTPIEVEVNEDQQPALKLYLKLGFVEIARESRNLGDGKTHVVITLAHNR